jgi:Vps16, C-terminal region
LTHVEQQQDRLHPPQIRALAEKQQWEALDAFSHERKAPVGLEAFIAAARAHGAPTGVLAR